MSKSNIIATFAVAAGTTVEFPLDVTGMTDQEIATAIAVAILAVVLVVAVVKS